MPLVMPDPATPRQLKRRAHMCDHPVRFALGFLAWVLAWAVLWAVVWPDGPLSKQFAVALTVWAVFTWIQVLIVRHDRATAWYAEWRAERQARA